MSQTMDKRRRVERHLEQRVDEEPIYVKSKFLAAKLELSPQEIGSVLGRLADSSSSLTVEKWSYLSTARESPAVHGGRESRKPGYSTAALLLVLSLQRIEACF